MDEAGDLTLTGTMDDLACSGFSEHFGVRGDELRSFDSGRRFSACQVVVRDYHRFEGVSDPDDMAIVYAIEGEGGVRGTLVDAFGAYSDPTVGAFLAAVPIRGVCAPSGFGDYHYGYPAPVAPSHDEGGEGGGLT